MQRENAKTMSPNYDVISLQFRTITQAKNYNEGKRSYVTCIRSVTYVLLRTSFSLNDWPMVICNIRQHPLHSISNVAFMPNFYLTFTQTDKFSWHKMSDHDALQFTTKQVDTNLIRQLYNRTPVTAVSGNSAMFIKTQVQKNGFYLNFDTINAWENNQCQEMERCHCWFFNGVWIIVTYYMIRKRPLLLFHVDTYNLWTKIQYTMMLL
jgi:hypothetical protein